MTFNEAEIEAQKNEDSVDDESKVTTVAEHQRKAKDHRKALPAEYPREIVKVELPPEEQVTSEREKLKIIGWEISGKLKLIPASRVVVQYHRAKYGVDSGDYRTIRQFATGRKNGHMLKLYSLSMPWHWLFAGTVEGADASALLYSLALTAKLNKVNPYTAMVKVLREVVKATTLEDVENLTEV